MISKETMESRFKNKDNEDYYTDYDGTGNLTYVAMAPLIACKGHYLDFQEDKKDILAIVKNRHTGKVIEPIADDDTEIWVEPTSGVTLKAR